MTIMKKYTIFFAALCIAIGFAACSSDDDYVGTSLSLDKMAFTLVIGEYETITATVFPETPQNRTITWRSEDTEIATVDNNGRVTALATGAVNIIATTADGVRATSRVTVRATPLPPVPVTEVRLNRTVASLILVDMTLLNAAGNPFNSVNNGARTTLTATVTPANATNRDVIWTSSDPTVATVNNNGRIDAVSEGVTTITVTTVDGGFTHTARVAVVDGVFIGTAIWARYNVADPGTFVENPEDAGMFFQWNRRQGWASTGTVTSWNTTVPTGASWRAPNNPCPAGWRLPTEGEMAALRTAVSTWTTVGGVTGRRITGANRIAGGGFDTIFLPAAGYRDAIGTLKEVGTKGMYWNSTQLSETLARGLRFSNHNTQLLSGNRMYALSVRCVANN